MPADLPLDMPPDMLPTHAAQSAAGSETTVYLARHGQSTWNNRALVTGQLDPPLSPKGEQQAQALAGCLAGVPLAALYVTGLQRTAQTAAPLAQTLGLALSAEPAFNEVHMGVLQGRLRDERDPEAQALWQQLQADPWGFQVPGGERFDAFAGRVEAALARLLARHAGASFALVGHRATNRVVMGVLMRWPRTRWHEIRLRSKFAYRIRLGSDPGQAPTIDTYVLSGGKAGSRLDGFVM